jgi:hypothetical protein
MSGDPNVRFGGRGHRNQSMLPTPILTPIGDKQTAAKVNRILEDHGWIEPVQGGAEINGKRRKEVRHLTTVSK